jgi:NTP pyrophosphatase (non-canonical NTP hydrolase)
MGDMSDSPYGDKPGNRPTWLNPPTPPPYRVWRAISIERARQYAMWGDQDHAPEWWLPILVEEVGEVGKAIVDGTPEEIEHEVVQVAAVAVQWLEAIERRKSDRAGE